MVKVVETATDCFRKAQVRELASLIFQAFASSRRKELRQRARQHLTAGCRHSFAQKAANPQRKRAPSWMAFAGLTGTSWTWSLRSALMAQRAISHEGPMQTAVGSKRSCASIAEKGLQREFRRAWSCVSWKKRCPTCRGYMGLTDHQQAKHAYFFLKLTMLCALYVQSQACLFSFCEVRVRHVSKLNIFL